MNIDIICIIWCAVKISKQIYFPHDWIIEVVAHTICVRIFSKSASKLLNCVLDHLLFVSLFWFFKVNLSSEISDFPKEGSAPEVPMHLNRCVLRWNGLICLWKYKYIWLGPPDSVLLLLLLYCSSCQKYQLF